MNQELHLETIYKNNLDIDKFSRMFNNKSQSYKFYWFEAILNLITETEEDLSFDEIIDEMICEAWHTVTHYHLRLGPTVNGNPMNFLEHAIYVLNSNSKDLSPNPSRDELKKAIQTSNPKLKADKVHLTDYVPYKLLYPFFDCVELKEGLTYIKNDQHRRLIAYMAQIADKSNLLYFIIDGKGLQKKVRVNSHWRQLLLKNYSIIRSWIQYNKAQFLQDRNPGVPGIIYKISPENEEQRKLDQARILWKTTVEITGQPLKEIYTGKELSLEAISIDHFVPRSFISNDELWNLIPMSKSLNSSKSNKLPSWEAYFSAFAAYQFYLYDLIFPTVPTTQTTILKNLFEKCRKNNINAIWASENLYISGNSDTVFINILEHNLKPIYEAAKMQGYETWEISR